MRITSKHDIQQKIDRYERLFRYPDNLRILILRKYLLRVKFPNYPPTSKFRKWSRFLVKDNSPNII